MKTTGFALVTASAAALLLPGVAGGCGGVTAALPGDGGTDGPPSSGSSSGGASSSSSSGVSGSTSSSGGMGSSSSSGVSSSSSSGGTSGSSSGGSSSSSSGSGSSSGVSSSSSSGGSSSGSSDTGSLYFEQCSGTGPLCQSPTFDFYASFGAANGGGNQGCTVTTSGECSSYSCTGTQTNPAGVSAGTLTISGGSVGTGVTVSPDSSNNYDYEATGTLFAAGQTLTVSASGATVPAFGPVSIVAPGLLVLTAPGATSGAYTIPTTSDLKVVWTGGSPNAQVLFEGATNGSSSYFTCVWAASLGEATVPQAMLTPLAGQTTGYLVYGQLTSTNFSAGAYSLSASALPYTGGTATFE